MIKRLAILFLAGFLGLFVQSSLIHSSFPAAIAPDFILILVVILAIHRRTVDAVITAFILGLLADFASGRFIGPNAAGCVVAFWIVGVFSSRVYSERGFALGFITAICCLAKSAVYLLMLAAYVDVAIFTVTTWKYVLIEAALSATAAPILVFLLSWSGRSGKKGKRKGSKGSFGWASSS